MNVRVVTRYGTFVDVVEWADAVVSFDTSILEVVDGGETTRFPLTSVVSFTTSESGTP